MIKDLCSLGPLSATRSTPKITVDSFRVKSKWELAIDGSSGINESADQQIGVYPNPGM
jgi:hypothetical protein